MINIFSPFIGRLHSDSKILGPSPFHNKIENPEHEIIDSEHDDGN